MIKRARMENGWAKTLLPDILRYDPSLRASYPANGRSLTDDVMDHFIALVTNGKNQGSCGSSRRPAHNVSLCRIATQITFRRNGRLTGLSLV
jgi:hypothetical protein